MTAVAENRKAFALRLHEVGRNLRFHGGKPALPHGDRELTIAVDLADIGPGGARHYVTVFAGFPAPAKVAGLRCILRRADDNQVVFRGLTDRRGQVKLDNLEPVDYLVSVVYRVTLPIPKEFEARVASYLGAGRAVEGQERLLLELNEVSGIYRASLRELVTEPPHLVLAVSAEPAVAAESVIYAELGTGAALPAAKMFLGLREGLAGQLFGEVSLSGLRGAVVPRWPVAGGDASLALSLEAVPIGDLTEDDRDLLNQSRGYAILTSPQHLTKAPTRYILNQTQDPATTTQSWPATSLSFVNCPHCGNRAGVTSEMWGRIVLCRNPGCRRPFPLHHHLLVPAEATTSPTHPTSGAEDPHGKRTSHEGANVPCPRCGARVPSRSRQCRCGYEFIESGE